MSWEITLLYYFSWNCTWFGQKEHINVQNFRPAHVKFHQICSLIGLFCWKYIKFQLKKYRGVMSHDTEEWCKIWGKADLLFEKWHEIGDFWPERSEVSKICTSIDSYCTKYLMFDLKNTEELSFMKLKSDRRETELWFKKWHEEFGTFSPEHSKVSKLGLWWGHFVQSRKCMSLKNLQRSYVSWQWTMMQNLKRNWLAISKLTSGIWQILTWTVENQISSLIGSFDQSI